MDDKIDMLESLLYEGASEALIFKPKEYKFNHALELEQGELLRDLLGAVNAWKRSDAYILIGVEEVQGGRNNVLGVIEHLDGEALDRFVRSKVQQPIKFSYIPQEYQKRKVGIIHVPLQERPVFLKENFANLKKYVVYVRRSGQVVEASTEEVGRMKEGPGKISQPDPSLSLEFAQGPERKTLGKRIIVKTFLIDVPSEDIIPDYTGPATHPMADFLPDEWQTAGPPVNKDYYRDLAFYYRRFGRVSKIDFGLSNPGSRPVYDVDLEINIEDEEGKFYFYEASDLPHLPSKLRAKNTLKPLLLQVDPAIAVSRVPQWWTVTIHFDEVLPNRTAFTAGGLFMGSKVDTVLEFDVSLRSRDLTDPVTLPLTIEFQTQKQKIGLESLMKII